MTIKTNRDFLTAVSKLTGIDTAITDYAVAAIAALDVKNEKRKNSKSAVAHRAEVDAFRTAVFATLTAEPMTAAEVAEVMGVESVPKVTAALTAFVKSGDVVKGERKVSACKAKGIKGGKFSVYSVPESGEPETDEDEAALSAEENAAGAEAYGGGF